MTMTGQRKLVSGAKVVRPPQVELLDILIEDERIAALLAPGTFEGEAERIDAKGLVVLPGAIDSHIHLGHGNDIARPRVPEDARSETGAAARGGVTTVISYVMSADPYENFFAEMVGVAEAGARIDFGFHFVISTQEQLAAVPRYIKEFGAPTTKLFMNIRGDEGKRLGLPAIDDGFAFALLEQLAEHGGMLCPHPENMEVVWLLAKRLRESGADGTLATWNDARPPFVEAEAIRRISYLAHIAGSPLYCVHTSSAEALEQALKARAEGFDIHIETCNHYLTHDVDTPIGIVGKINPPLRKPADREALWQGLAAGHIDTLASDHIHRGLGAKSGDIWTASPGCPGLDTFLQVPLSEGHHKRGLSLARIAEVTAQTPARLMGLRRKGRIEVGMDADFAFVDLDAEKTIGKDDVASDAGYSIYEGHTLRGAVVHTMSRGRFALRDGMLVDAAVGQGRYQHRVLGKGGATA
jgi:dihydropyrimidinase